MTDANGREVKLWDTVFVPSDCDGLQFIGVVTDVDSKGFIDITQLSISKYSMEIRTNVSKIPQDVRVLCSIEETREVEHV